MFAYTDFKDYAKILYSIIFDEQLFTTMKEEIIKMSVYEEIQKEFCENDEDMVGLNLFMLGSGPQLVDD